MRDEASTHVASFLEGVQDAREALLPLRNALTRRGMRCMGPAVVLSGRPVRIHERGGYREFAGDLTLALQAELPSGPPMEFSVSILWRKDGWAVEAEVSVERAEGFVALKTLERRTAATLEGCLAALRAAVADLSREEKAVEAARR